MFHLCKIPNLREMEIDKSLSQDLENIDMQIFQIESKISKLQNERLDLMKRKDDLENSLKLKKSLALPKKDFNNEDFEWSEKLSSVLKNTFNLSHFRGNQLSTINATLSGVDCILIMPTGGGKSLCFQLPALLDNGVTLVVSPLVSLMEDQLMSLHKLNIDAKMLSATCSREETNSILKSMTDTSSGLKLLYVTPEKLSKSKRFMTQLQKMYKAGRFDRLAVDEVHCCSHWGHDFRPDYKYLGVMRKLFPDVPIIGLTATATSKVISDVQKILNIQGCLLFKSSFNRPNLYYEVRRKPTSKEGCVDEIAKLLRGEFRGQSGIIYTLSIKDAEELAQSLRDDGFKVAPYHANLSADSRSNIHRKWVQNVYQVVVATIAFGMGIDKPDVRFVIHHCISKSLENFYQESGRSGRDDKASRCIVFWRLADMFRQSSMVFTDNTGLENLYGMVDYCLSSSKCRRQLIAHHFDEVWESTQCEKNCDHCSTSRQRKEIDMQKYGANLLKILKNASDHDSRLTGTKLVDIWLGKGAANLRVKEATQIGLDRAKAEDIIAHLLVDGFLQEDFHFTPYTTISYIIPGPKSEAGLTPSPRIITVPVLNVSKKIKLSVDEVTIE